MKIKAMTIPELWRLARRLQEGGHFNKDAHGNSRSLDFGEREDGPDDASSWWGTLPVSHFDDDTWLVGYFGGGNTVAVDISDDPTEDEKEERFVEAVRGLLDVEKHPDYEVYVDADHIPAKYFVNLEKNFTPDQE
jgi:hypothetical protein